jgi:YVTN family beta-propeller protein
MRRLVALAALLPVLVFPSASLAAEDHCHPIVVVHQSAQGTSARSGSMTLLDHDTFEVTGTVSLAMQPRPMGFDATGNWLIVLGQSVAREGTGESTRPWRLFLVDIRSGKARDLGDVGLPPVGFALSAETNRAFLLGGDKKKGGLLTVVDLAEQKVLRRLPAPAGRPTAILGPGSKVLFAEFGYGEARPGDPDPRMLVFDAATLEVLADQALDPSPRRPVMSLDESFVYVASAGRTGEKPVDGGLFVFDAKTGRLAAKIATGPGTKAVAPDPDHGLEWVVSTGGGDGTGMLTAVRGDQAAGRIPLSVGYGNVFPVPGGDMVLVMGRNAVHGVHAVSLEKVRSWALDFEPAYAVIDTARGRAWISAGYGPDFAAVDLASDRVLARLRAGGPDAAGKYPAEPGSLVMTMNPDGKRVFLANTRTDDVTVVNAETLAIEEIVATGGRTDSVLLSPGGACVYVVGEDALVRIDRDTLEAVRQCALAARSGLAGVVNVHDGVAVVPQASAVEFIALDDGRSLGRREFGQPVDYVFVASPEK